MTRSYKPQGYNSVSAYLLARHAQRVMDFLTEVFNARMTRRFENTDGSIRHAEVQMDDSVVMIGIAGSDAFPVHMHVYVPDVDAAYQRALQAGGTSVQEPMQHDDPDRRAGVRDPDGNTWWIGTQVG